MSIVKATISGPSEFTNTLALVDLTTNIPLQLSSKLTIDGGGVLALNNSAVSSVRLNIDHGGALYMTNSLLQESGLITTMDIINGSGWLESGLADLTGVQ